MIPNQPEFRAVFDAALPPNVHVQVYNAPQGRFAWCENSLYDQGEILLDDDTGKFTRYHDNLLAVCAAYTVFESDVEGMIAALGNWQPEPGRGVQSLVQLGLGGQITVIDDSYNASLPSMLACLEDLACTTGGRKIAVLGDMKELGSLTLLTHQQLIMRLNHYSFDAVFVVGEVFVALSPEIDRLIHAADCAEEIFTLLVAYLKAGDVVAFKASRSVGLDRVVRGLSNPQLQELRPC
ncbi:MAG: hypothetical protein HRT36_01295 [Alphaproteobacteria bacterium]|nr:hypothetical protein [Alphaproteobacteria bacterium]